MTNFSSKITEWYLENQRHLPWRETSDPYKIWLSEIILQQTQISQGLPYYVKFIEHFPTVYDLAEVSEEEILKLWQGLGYYSRARNLHYTAKTIVENYNGVFPDTYKELKKLKGIGDYTASAVASICHNEPVAALDGNVFRVLSRVLGIDTPINSTEGRKLFKNKAEELLDRSNSGQYNQAIMEFGAIQCKPKKPLCMICPLQKDCVAFQQGKVKELPVKLKKTKVRTRHLNYLVFVSEDNKTYIHQRTGKGIWRNLYEFPLLETKKEIKQSSSLNHNLNINSEKIFPFKPKPIKHLLSHQKLFVKFWIVRLSRLPEFPQKEGKELKSINWAQIEKFPVPAIIDKFLKTFNFKE